MMFKMVRIRLTTPKMSTSVGIEQLYTNSYELSTSSGQYGGEGSTAVTSESTDYRKKRSMINWCPDSLQNSVSTAGKFSSHVEGNVFTSRLSFHFSSPPPPHPHIESTFKIASLFINFFSQNSQFLYFPLTKSSPFTTSKSIRWLRTEDISGSLFD